MSVCMGGPQEQLKQLSSSQLKKLAGGCVVIPSFVTCLVPAAEWSFLYSREATAAKMGTPLPSLPAEKRLGAGGCLLFSITSPHPLSPDA